MYNSDRTTAQGAARGHAGARPADLVAVFRLRAFLVSGDVKWVRVTESRLGSCSRPWPGRHSAATACVGTQKPHGFAEPPWEFSLFVSLAASRCPSLGLSRSSPVIGREGQVGGEGVMCPAPMPLSGDRGLGRADRS